MNMNPCYFCNKFIRCLLIITLLCFVSVDFAYARATFSFTAKDYAHQQYLENESIQAIDQKGYVKGTGAIEYKFLVKNADAGWYELWMAATDWPTDIFLDDTLLEHTVLQSKIWAKSGTLQKVINLNLSIGNHSIRFERLYFPGLPYIYSIALKPSTDISGSVHVKPETDALVFRLNEAFQISLVAGKSLYSI